MSTSIGFKILASARRSLLRFLRSESGMTLPLLGLSMITLMGFTGVAIDLGRGQMLQSKLQFSLDAAGLAGGATVSTASLTTETAKYFNSNFNNYMGATVTGFSVTPNSDATVFTLSATATIPTDFMSILGVNTITVSATSQITRAITGVELVMVLDNTASMANSAGAGGTKIQALKDAANALVTNLTANAASTSGKLYIGIVPFTETVNIGTSNTAWINPRYAYDHASTPLDWGPGGAWEGCVDQRIYPADTTDDPPSASAPSTQFGMFYYTSANLNPNYNAAYAAAGAYANMWKYPLGTYAIGTGWVVRGSTVYYMPTPDYYSNPSTATSGPNHDCTTQSITPMTSNASVLQASINAMQPAGGTVLTTGLQWGWFMLSPKWRGTWGGSMAANGLPLNYNTPGMIKAVVFVTDGNNFPDLCANASCTDGIDNTEHTAYWYDDEGRMASTGSSGSISTLNDRTLAICNAMKSAGIYVYTIGLGTDGGIDTSLLKSCATAENYYFLSPNSADLQSIFGSIGDSLSSLRVSQ